MFEMWFFACIRKVGLNVCDQHDNTTESWPACVVTIFDNIPLLPEGGIWLKPKKWNQGGYDAVFVDKSNEL